MLLAIPEVDELFPVELSVEAALELWLKRSESSDSRVLNEFLDILLVILDSCILVADTGETEDMSPWPLLLPLPLAMMLVMDLFLHFLIGVGENEEMEEFELETGEDWLGLGLVILLLLLLLRLLLLEIAF